jgi:hypothetical protein
MKKIFYVFFLVLVFISCSKKDEVKFEAFSPEAFAYDIGDAWEVNATVNVKGFIKKEVGEKLSASLDLFVDLVNPDSSRVESIFVDSKEVTDNELIDIQLETQFELDYDSVEGIYMIIFKIVDNYSGKEISSQTEFELKK